MQSIETIFINANLQHDRFFNESFQLPYNFDDIKIEANDLCTFRVINDALGKLYDNFLYLFGLTKMASNVVPVSLSGIYAVSGNNTNAQWYTSLNEDNVSPFSQAGLNYLDNANANSLVYSEIYSQYLMAITTPESLTIAAMDENDTSFSIVLSSQVADNDITLPFKDIKATCFIDDYLYVLDSYYNNIYRYDLKGLLTDDIFPKTLQIDNQIGGYGVFQDKYKFNNPTSICSTNTDLYVLDAGNFCIKRYDKNLVNKDVYQYRSIFGTDQPLSIAADNYTGKVAVATTNKLLYVFEADFLTYTVVDISSRFSTDAVLRNIFISKAYSNCLYIVTSKDIYKCYLSKPSNQIGKYTMYRFGISPNNLLCASNTIGNQDSTLDEIYVFASTREIDYLIHTKDSKNYVDVTSIPDFDVYTKEEIYVNKDEYTQTWVINKAIIKLLLNHLRLKDKIKGRFTGKYDTNGNPLLDGTLYFLLDDLDLTGYQITLDHLAGNNEVLSSAVVNRALKKIYDLQTSIINKSNTILQTSSYFENQSVSIG